MAELWQMTREQFFNNPDLVRSHIPEANKGFKVSYKYIDPNPGGPFVGDMVVSNKPAKGSEIPATFGRAKVTAVSPAKPQKLDNMQLFTAGKKIHREAVQKAVRDGKHVPLDVLRDYPDLSPKGASMSTAVTMSRKDRYAASLAASKPLERLGSTPAEKGQNAAKRDNANAAVIDRAIAWAKRAAGPHANRTQIEGQLQNAWFNMAEVKSAFKTRQEFMQAAMAKLPAGASVSAAAPPPATPEPSADEPAAAPQPNSRRAKYLRAKYAGTLGGSPAASAGHVPFGGDGSVPAKNWFSKPKPQSPPPAEKPAAAGFAPASDRWDEAGYKDATANRPPQKVPPKFQQSYQKGFSRGLVERRRGKPASASGVVSAATQSVSRKQYDAMIQGDSAWMKTVWPKLKKTMNINGAIVTGTPEQIAELKAKMQANPVGASAVSAGPNDDKQAAVQAKLKAKGFVLGTGKPMLFGPGGAIPYRREWAPNKLVLAKLSNPFEDFKPTTQAEVAKLIGLEDQLKASVSAAVGGTPEEGQTVIHPKYGKGVVQFVDKRGPKEWWVLVVRTPNGQITRPASEFNAAGAGASVSAAAPLSPADRQLRQNVRNFLMTATLDELKKELAISKQRGDAKRAQFVQELIDEESGAGASISAAGKASGREISINKLQAMARDGKLEYSTDPKVGAHIEVRWPNGKREWIMVRPAKGAGASRTVSAAVVKQMNHGAYQQSLKTKSPAELQYIIKDAREAIKAMPDGPNAGYYQDEIHYAGMELKKRQGKGASASVSAAGVVSADLGSDLERLSAESGSRIRDSYYKAAAGLSSLVEALRRLPKGSGASFMAELAIADNARRTLDKSSLGKYV